MLEVNPAQQGNKTLALIVAAGVGSRMQADRPKQYLPINSTQTILEATVSKFTGHTDIDTVVVAVSPTDPYVDSMEMPGASILRTGGATRAETVYQTLLALIESNILATNDLVLVHDAARPYIEAKDISALIEATRTDLCIKRSAGCVLTMGLFDTVKRIDNQGFLVEDVDRNGLVRIATPQCFTANTLLEALAGRLDAPDESTAVRALGLPVRTVLGSSENRKITTPHDLKPVEQKNTMKAIRIGNGYDSHRLVEGRPLILGGIQIEHTHGLDGHSDADALLHAITDAVLGAAALGNIGTFFPDTDPQYKGADSALLLAKAWEAVKTQGWTIGNLDTVIVAQKPKLNPHVPAMREKIACILDTTVDCVSIKPKTNERLGFEGRLEGISTQAVVLLVKS